MQQINKKQVDYILREIVDTTWRPYPLLIPSDQVEAEYRFHNVLNQCGSKLEIAAILGLCAYIDLTCRHEGATNCLTSFTFLQYNNTIHDAIWIVEPFVGFHGPSAIGIVPQLPFAEGYHHDFGIFHSHDNGGSNWNLAYAIEVDGVATHRKRRDKDSYRDSLVDYPVIRLYEETIDLFLWAEDYMAEFPKGNNVPWDTDGTLHLIPKTDYSPQQDRWS